MSGSLVFKVIGASAVIGGIIFRAWSLSPGRRPRLLDDVRALIGLPDRALIDIIRDDHVASVFEQGNDLSAVYTRCHEVLRWTENDKYVFRDTECLNYLMPKIRQANCLRYGEHISLFVTGGFGKTVFREAIALEHWQFARRWFTLYREYCGVSVENFHCLLQKGVRAILQADAYAGKYESQCDQLFALLQCLLVQLYPDSVTNQSHQWKRLVHYSERYQKLAACVAEDDGSGFEIETIISSTMAPELQRAIKRRHQFRHVVRESLSCSGVIPDIATIVLVCLNGKKRC